jgi:hypothetical protein
MSKLRIKVRRIHRYRAVMASMGRPIDHLSDEQVHAQLTQCRAGGINVDRSMAAMERWVSENGAKRPTGAHEPGVESSGGQADGKL